MGKGAVRNGCTQPGCSVSQQLMGEGAVRNGCTQPGCSVSQRLVGEGAVRNGCTQPGCSVSQRLMGEGAVRNGCTQPGCSVSQRLMGEGAVRNGCTQPGCSVSQRLVGDGAVRMGFVDTGGGWRRAGLRAGGSAARGWRRADVEATEAFWPHVSLSHQAGRQGQQLCGPEPGHQVVVVHAVHHPHPAVPQPPARAACVQRHVGARAQRGLHVALTGSLHQQPRFHPAVGLLTDPLESDGFVQKLTWGPATHSQSCTVT